MWRLLCPVVIRAETSVVGLCLIAQRGSVLSQSCVETRLLLLVRLVLVRFVVVLRRL